MRATDGESKPRQLHEEEIPREDSALCEKHERPSSAGEPGLFTAFATLRADGRLILVPPQLGQHTVVFQRGGVADGLSAGGDVAQQPAHDLAAAGLR